VTAEPLPSRIASVALGTGDVDCVYHMALHELGESVKEISDETLSEMYNLMVDGKRLRDISDLPFDLAI
jgi:NgoMIV restriction enzyme